MKKMVMEARRDGGTKGGYSHMTLYRLGLHERKDRKEGT